MRNISLIVHYFYSLTKTSHSGLLAQFLGFNPISSNPLTTEVLNFVPLSTMRPPKKKWPQKKYLSSPGSQFADMSRPRLSINAGYIKCICLLLVWHLSWAQLSTFSKLAIFGTENGVTFRNLPYLCNHEGYCNSVSGIQN